MPQIDPTAAERSGHDARTEVLTRAGWKLFAVVSNNDELATVDPLTAALTYESPIELTRFDYSGTMIAGHHKHINFWVTPNHRLLIRHWNEQLRTLSDDYQFRDAKNLGWYCGLLTRVEWNGGISASDTYVVAGIDTHRKAQRENVLLTMRAWLRFVGIYLAEGTLVPVYSNEHRIQIAAMKPRERCFVIDTLRSIGIETTHNIKDRFAFSNHQLYEGLAVLGLAGVHAPHKFVPPFVFEQTACNIREFLLGHFSGDGADNGSGVRRHYTASKQLAEDLQRLIFLSGDEAYVRVREPRKTTLKDGRKIIGRYPEYCTSVCERRLSSIERARHVSEEHYRGEIFGAVVPSNHTLVTRREGCVTISGDSAVDKIAVVPRITFRRGSA